MFSAASPITRQAASPNFSLGTGEPRPPTLLPQPETQPPAAFPGGLPIADRIRSSVVRNKLLGPEPTNKVSAHHYQQGAEKLRLHNMMPANRQVLRAI